jgi:hypothetical protein
MYPLYNYYMLIKKGPVELEKAKDQSMPVEGLIVHLPVSVQR